MKSIKEKIKNWIYIDLTFLLVACCYFLLMRLIGDTCLIHHFTGLHCATCGSTRALICLLKFDFCGYAYYNVLALPTLIIVYFYAHFGGANKKCFNVLAIVVALALTLRYIIIYF